MTDLSWLKPALNAAGPFEIPVRTTWRAPRDVIMVLPGPTGAPASITMHPFMSDQIASSDVFDWLARVERRIVDVIEWRAAAAVRRIDQACDVDSLEA